MSLFLVYGSDEAGEGVVRLEYKVMFLQKSVRAAFFFLSLAALSCRILLHLLCPAWRIGLETKARRHCVHIDGSFAGRGDEMRGRNRDAMSGEEEGGVEETKKKNLEPKSIIFRERDKFESKKNGISRSIMRKVGNSVAQLRISSLDRAIKVWKCAACGRTWKLSSCELI